MTLDEVRGLKEPRLQEICSHVSDVAGSTPAMALYVPGRIELLGKHTDYAGGVSVTCASSRRMVAIVHTVKDRALLIEDAVTGQAERIGFDDTESPKGWVSYAHAAMRRTLRTAGRPSRGIRIVFSGDIPRAAGMSSSSALLTMCVLGMYLIPEVAASGLVNGPEELSGFLGAVESGAAFGVLRGDEGVGTKGGSQDHTAIVMSLDGVASVFGYHPVQRLVELPWPSDMHLMIGVSGVRAPKRTRALGAYNAASDLATRLGVAWARSHPEDEPLLGAALESDLFEETAMIEIIDSIANGPDDREALWHRFSQFHDECTVVIPDALDAWQSEDWTAFGEAVSRSQEMASEWLGNQIPETNVLARLARESGALAASAFGAGYGGSVWALVPAGQSAAVMERWSTAYTELYPEHAAKAHFFRDRPSAGVRVIGAPPELDALLETSD